MSSGITLTAATRQNLLSLQGTADLLSATQNKLSTGKKVNSALDNPTNFFTAQSLNNRSKDLSGLLDGISNGIQTIQAANQGITSIQKLVDSAKSTANQALATKSTATGASATGANITAGISIKAAAGTADGTIDFSTSTDSAAFKITDANGLATTVTIDGNALAGKAADLKKVTSDEILSEINKQLTDKGGAGAQVTASLTSDGRLNFQSTATGSDSTLKVEAVSTATKDIGFAANGFTALTATGVNATDGSTKASATGASATGVAAAKAGVAAATDYSINIQLGDGAAKKIDLNSAASGASLTTGDKAAAIADAINKQIQSDVGLQGKVIAEGNDTTGAITIRTTASGADQKITVTSAGAGDIGFGVNTSASTIAAGKATGTGGGSTSANGANARSALAQQFNDLLTQITQQAQDSSYNGVNLLYRSGSDPKENTLHISFNEKDTSSLDIKGSKLDAAGLGIATTSSNFASDDDIKTALSQLTTASATLRTQASTFGSNLTVVQNRQDFSKQLSNILDTGAANLTNADLNEEAANSQALSTRQSIGISALSLANTAQQGILQLLR
jgi:flagellin-like hook-associated protein FlgL